MGSRKKTATKANKQQLQRQRALLIKRLKPLLWALSAWFLANALVHLPGISEPFSRFFVDFTTRSAYWFGRILQFPVEMPGPPYLTVKGFPMRVIMECTAYNFYFFVAALALFSPVKWSQRLARLGIYLAGIFILNNFRFISMGYVGHFWPEAFDMVHDIVWNVLFGFMVFAIWFWMEMRQPRSDVHERESDRFTPQPNHKKTKQT